MYYITKLDFRRPNLAVQLIMQRVILQWQPYTKPMDIVM